MRCHSFQGASEKISTREKTERAIQEVGQLESEYVGYILLADTQFNAWGCVWQKAFRETSLDSALTTKDEVWLTLLLDKKMLTKAQGNLLPFIGLIDDNKTMVNEMIFKGRQEPQMSNSHALQIITNTGMQYLLKWSQPIPTRARPCLQDVLTCTLGG